MATDYTLPPVAEKRTRFFDGQFLVDQDFVDEQKYHLDRQPASTPSRSARARPSTPRAARSRSPPP
jgi:hypothetical protein